ncbi:MAG: MFS transporter, partial [Actinomycetota bacterium]|nr:MFS transporter [Actinomycetota bacterium]
CVAGGTVLFNVVSLTYRQRSTPPHLRGRVNASARFACWGLIPLGALVGGLVATVDLRLALWLAAVGKLLAVVPLLSSRLAGIDMAGRPRPLRAATPS